MQKEGVKEVQGQESVGGVSAKRIRRDIFHHMKGGLLERNGKDRQSVLKI